MTLWSTRLPPRAVRFISLHTSTKTNWKILKLKGSDETSGADSRWAGTYISELATCSFFEIQIRVHSIEVIWK